MADVCRNCQREEGKPHAGHCVWHGLVKVSHLEFTLPDHTLPDHSVIPAAMPAVGSPSKPSNPKDVVGIGKIPSSVVSQTVLMEVGLAMMEGGLKYGRHNYRDAGVRSSVYFDATMRHLMQWWEGQDTDPDSGLSHVTKAITSLIVLRDAMIMGMAEDDRPPKLTSLDGFIADLNAKAKGLLERYGHLQPEHITERRQQERREKHASRTGPVGNHLEHPAVGDGG